MDSIISHNEFVLIKNIPKEFCDRKEVLIINENLNFV